MAIFRTLIHATLTLVAGAVRRGDAPGLAAAVAMGGGIVWAEGFGHADHGRGTPATAATVFGIGSISKTLTLADEFANRHYSDTTHFPDLETAYREIRRERLVYRPGTRAECATGLFTIVGRAMERAEGLPYEEIMRRRVFAVAGMTATAPNDPRRPPPGRTAFHLRGDGGGFREAPPFDPSHKLAGAGFLSTAPDLARFGSALLGSGLISEAARSEMFTPVPLAHGRPTRYGLGFQVVREDGRRVLIQPGGGIGIAAWLTLYPDDGLVVALLANVTGAPLEDERRAVGEAFLAGR